MDDGGDRVRVGGVCALRSERFGEFVCSQLREATNLSVFTYRPPMPMDGGTGMLQKS